MYRNGKWRAKSITGAAAITAIAVLWAGAAVGVVAGVARGGWGSMMGVGMMGRQADTGACRPSAVSGQSIRYTAVDAGGMMGGAMFRFMPGSSIVRSGTVTIDLLNQGTRPHELLVFRLAADQVPGSRPIGNNDRVSEVGLVGEVTPLCAQDKSIDGLAPGNVGRVSLQLAPGRYEIVCNLPGHYRRGMWATLEVVQ